MLTKYKIIIYLSLGLLILPLSEVSANETPNYTEVSQSAAAINFTAKDMMVMSVAEWSKAELEYPEITAALQEYHATTKYTQTLEDFRQNPNNYFSVRKSALNNLISAIPTHTNSPVLKLLGTQTKNKKIYLEAIPSMLDPRSTKREALPDDLDLKAIKVKDSYWSEVLDPLHRFGPAISERLQRWAASPIPNYFIFLETIEDDALLNKFAPMDSQVQYFYTEAEREPHRITIKDGLFYLGGKLFDTKTFNTVHAGSGFAIFILGPNNEIYVNEHIKYKLHHSSEFAGQEVLGAGEVLVRDGRLLKVSNKSGHYGPKESDMIDALKVFKSKLQSLEGIEVEMIMRSNKTGTHITAAFEAEDLLASNGRSLAISAKHNLSPLHVAVWANHIELADKALSMFNIDAQTDTGSTPLHLAAQEGNIEWISRLLASGANAKCRDLNSDTPLHIASRTGNLPAIELLMPHSDPAQKNAMGDTPLMLAVRSGNIQAYEYFVQRGLSVQDCDNDGSHIFHYAANSGNTHLLAHLLNQKTLAEKIHVSNRYGASPLHFASSNGHPDMIIMLREQGLNPEDVDDNGNNALHYAAFKGNAQTVDFLLSNNPGLFWIKNNNGELPYHLGASALPYPQLAKFISLAGSTEIQDNKGNTPLHHAVASQSPQAEKNLHLLIAHGSNIHAANYSGMLPVHMAAQNGTNLLPLLTYSDDLSLVDGQGNSPLHITLLNNNLYVSESIIPFTSKETILHKNLQGWNILDIATHLGNKELLELLQKHLEE